MKMIWFLLLLMLAAIHLTLQQSEGCMTCLNAEVCLPSNQCSYTAVATCRNNCSTEDQVVIVNCSSNGNRLLEQDSASSDCENSSPSTTIPERAQSIDINESFYITSRLQFCRNECISQILAVNSTRLNLSIPRMEFYVYERFSINREHLYVEQQAFNSTLRYDEMSGFLVAEPVGSVCVKRGDYLGFRFNNMMLRGYQLVTDEGVYRQPYSPCPGKFEVENNAVELELMEPLMFVLYTSDTDLHVTTSSQTDMPMTTDAITTEFITTVAVTTVSSTTQFSTNTTGVLDSTAPGVIIKNSNLIAIAGAGFGGAVVLTVPITLIVITILYLIHSSKKREVRYSSSSKSTLPNDDLISMNTCNSQYMETHSFEPPRRFYEVETVVNPIAETPDDHVYNDPFGINGARACEVPNLLVNNVHYVSHVREPTSPHYHDPDDVLSGIAAKRSTLRNPLYSPTGSPMRYAVSEFTKNEGGNVIIYDEPHELEHKKKEENKTFHEYNELTNPSMVNTGTESSQTTFPKYSSETANIYRETDSDNETEPNDDKLDSVCVQYSLPVSSEPKSKIGLSDVTSDTNSHNYHELEPTGEVAQSTGHHYHLLDNKYDESGSDNDSEKGSITRSNVHHIVNELGAYVPNAEERTELFSGKDTLPKETYDLWKKSSGKQRKFFVRSEKFWIPSKQEKVLFDQLNQKKFREIIKDDLTFERHIGEGQFGSVQQAKLKGVKTVAVKIMKASSKEDARVKFLQEAAILGQFYHSNVVKLFGLVTMSTPMMIVMEYMQLGDLQTYLCKNYRPKSSAPPNSKTLLYFCRQIACGMKYLARMHFVHRDLAARNIFVSETLLCKIGDFGMSRNLLEDNYYISHGGIVPIKWTAPEGLNYKKYSTASDVYSYGMTLFEIWSLGEKPLRDIPLEKVAKTITSGYCQPPPPGTPRKIYSIMVQCWNPEYSKRPTFDDLFEILNGCDDDLLDWSKEDKDTQKASVIGSPVEDGKYLYQDLQSTYNGVTPDN